MPRTASYLFGNMDEYNLEYYRELNREEESQAKALAEAITELYHPQTVVDLGCATGLYLAPFKCEIAGFDISPAAFEDEVRRVSRDKVGLLDLTTPVLFRPKSDIALCLEVVEHIGSERVGPLVANICQASDTIIMTAAPPGQAGLNHINCQPQSYWEAKFADHGFKRDYHDEYQLAFRVWQVPHTLWLVRNLMVFKKLA